MRNESESGRRESGGCLAALSTSGNRAEERRRMNCGGRQKKEREMKEKGVYIWYTIIQRMRAIGKAIGNGQSQDGSSKESEK